MTAIKAHLFAVLLTLSAMAASQAAQPGAALAVRQPQPTQGEWQRMRSACVCPADLPPYLLHSHSASTGLQRRIRVR